MAAPELIAKRILLYIILPPALLVALFTLFDSIIMPGITRHGNELVLPQITGKTEFEAETILASLGLKLEIAGREYSTDRPEGTILTQIPVAGTRVKSGRHVKVVVSAGLKVAEVPDVVGLPLSQANLALQKAGFVVGSLYWVRVDTLPKNVAIETIPSGGTILPVGSKVSLAISQGAEQNIVAVPQLIGIPFERARQRLESLGLVVGRIEYSSDPLYLPYTVLNQEPQSNTPLIRGDSVHLILSRTN